MELFNVYACGGAGINIIKKVNNVGCKKIFIDTSTSNMKGVNSDNTFLIEDMDGAGKHRQTTYELFKDFHSDVLIKFKPSDVLNIVVSSLSGGSGSIIAPMIAKELLRQGKNVIVVAIGSNNSAIELNNTIKTLKTYKSLSDVTGKCLSMLHIENNKRETADTNVAMFLNIVSILLNREITEEFDTTDLTNFIHFNKVTENEPNVGILNIQNNVNIVPTKNTTVVSTIFITKNKNDVLLPVKPEYLATCMVSDENFKDSIRLNNVLGQLSEILVNYEKELTEFQENKSVNRFKDVEVKGNSDGIVL